MMNREHLITLYPRYSKLLDFANRNVLFHKWCKQNKVYPLCKDKFEMYDRIICTINNEPIHYLEFGVFSGKTIKYWMSHNTNKASKFYGFDSFRGLPENWDGSHKKGKFDVKGIPPKVSDERCTFVIGLFQDTLHSFLKEYDYSSTTRKIIHMDADLYSSTLFVLSQIHHTLHPGDIIMFDEFSDLFNEFQAWCDYQKSFYTKYHIINATTNYKQVAFEVK